ncbi:MAG: hypothetical protein FWD18_08980 [Micrococcales bacterium]|nr:hypothetical protein [Micrococcales bacterium]
MAKDPALATLLEETDISVRYEVAVFDPDRRAVGSVLIPADENEEGIRIDGDGGLAFIARPLVGKILRHHQQNRVWPQSVQHVS